MRTMLRGSSSGSACTSANPFFSVANSSASSAVTSFRVRWAVSATKAFG